MSGLCVVFDLDDTLYPEASYARGGLRAAGLRALLNDAPFVAIARLVASVRSGRVDAALQLSSLGFVDRVVWQVSSEPAINPGVGIEAVTGS